MNKLLPSKDIELLSLANAGSYPYKLKFYQVKDFILERYGIPDGYDLQILEDACYNCDGAGCWRCDKGVWSRRQWYLLRFKLGRHVFHQPVGFLPAQYDRQKDLRETIKGRICHAPVDYRLAERAAFRLMRKYQPILWLWVHKDRLWRALYLLRVRTVWAWRRLLDRLYKHDSDREVPF